MFLIVLFGKLPHDVFHEEPLPVLREAGRRPNTFIHRQANKPAVQQALSLEVPPIECRWAGFIGTILISAAFGPLLPRANGAPDGAQRDPIPSAIIWISKLYRCWLRPEVVKLVSNGWNMSVGYSANGEVGKVTFFNGSTSSKS